MNYTHNIDLLYMNSDSAGSPYEFNNGDFHTDWINISLEICDVLILVVENHSLP